MHGDMHCGRETGARNREVTVMGGTITGAIRGGTGLVTASALVLLIEETPWRIGLWGLSGPSTEILAVETTVR